MRSRLIGCALASLSAFVLIASLPSLAGARTARAQEPPLTSGTGYLALGDSVTFGYEESGVSPKPNYHDASSFIGYPEQIGKELHVKVTNAACPGETSASFVNSAAQSNGCENLPGGGKTAYRTLFPLHVRYQGSQLDFAVRYLRSHHNVRLVSLMIGANDGFVCREVTADHCASPAEQRTVLTTIATNVKRILSAVRTRAHYSGQIVIVNYYSLDYASSVVTAQSSAINTTMDQAAKPFHVRIASGFNEFFLQARTFSGDVCAAGLLTRLSGGEPSCGIHPSYAGQALLAQALLKVTQL
jgi:lysophospholipase L1-like esterase